MDGSLKGLEVLVIEDEPLLRLEIVDFLESRELEVIAAGDLSEAVNCLEGRTYDLILADVNLPDGSSMDLLRSGTLSANIGVIIMTADGGVDIAVEAMRLGAGDYLSKPFDPEELALVIHRLIRSRKQERIATHHRKQASVEGGFYFGEAMTEMKAKLELILEADERLEHKLPPILLQGETGTGKSSIARWIHQNGPRADKPFVEINCAALPETLAESELFGHEKGSFTDAKSDRLGLFEAADGGTLFLDEIGSLSSGIQAKILTAIELHEIRRVGGRKSIAIDARLIVASLEDLPTAVQAGRFREDLYHRLDLLCLTMPPLRERKADIEALAEFFLTSLRERYRAPDVVLSPLGVRYLKAYEWPGNLRELSHELERGIIFSGGKALDLGETAASGSTAVNEEAGNASMRHPTWSVPDEGFDLQTAMKALENELIEETLEAVDGNISAAARRLGVPRDYLRYRLER